MTEYKAYKRKIEKEQKAAKISNPKKKTDRKFLFNYNKRREENNQKPNSIICKEHNRFQKELNKQVKCMKNSGKVSPIRFQKNREASIAKK